MIVKLLTEHHLEIFPTATLFEISCTDSNVLTFESQGDPLVIMFHYLTRNVGVEIPRVGPRNAHHGVYQTDWT